ncbi:hypothetical protein PIIN_03587 [Serendipita indica DSM 11827]|uniref:Uncharacterized protein n=1 Tax=Serendipita indica (strain DSM 11827) TaxID=1109443 RepID=G4TEA5_SERID|nr:hypothetical protein PIIN_03587 [Serendipita indica DSM 11827]
MYLCHFQIRPARHNSDPTTPSRGPFIEQWSTLQNIIKLDRRLMMAWRTNGTLHIQLGNTSTAACAFCRFKTPEIQMLLHQFHSGSPNVHMLSATTI